MAQFPQTVKLCSQVGGLVPKKRLPMEPPMGHSTRAAGNGAFVFIFFMRTLLFVLYVFMPQVVCSTPEQPLRPNGFP